MSDSRGEVDALYILNQNVAIADVHRNNAERRISSMVVITSHALFPSEAQQLRDTEVRVEAVLDFTEFLDDRRLEQCDLDAYEHCARDGNANLGARTQEESLYRKNVLIRDEATARWRFGAVYHGAGLGISERAWSEGSGAQALAARPGGWLTPQLRRAGRLFRRARDRFVSQPLQIVADDGTTVFFVTDTRRLRFKPATRMRTVEVSGGRSGIERFIERYATETDKVLGTTIHNYQPQQRSARFPLDIFVDGYHPTNYPLTYLASYPTERFVIRDMLDNAWFTGNGRITRKPYGFLDRGVMHEPQLEAVRTVSLILNHAGDWTALINRADTDILIRSFVKLAPRHPEVEFVVRTHPTMAHVDHEGLRSIDRVAAFVAGCGFDNLQHSNATLEEDMARADVIVSEYSNVLLDGYREGIVGLIVNLTRRRSFMQDYTDLGFLTADSEPGFHTLVGEVIADPETHRAMQATAAARYNAKLEAFLTEAAHA